MTGPALPLTDPLPPVPVRAWHKAVGAVFFLTAFSFTCLWTIVCATAVFVVVPFSRTGELLSRITVGWAAGILGVAGMKVETHQEAPLPDGPVVFACNHQSQFDILALFVGLPRRFVFVAKKSVFRYPFLGWGIRAMRFIPVDRSNRAAAIRSLEEAAQRVRRGLSVSVFPEGTRSFDGSILPFKKGPFMLALHAGVPIVPVAIEGSLHANPKRRWYLCPSTIRILIGPPVPTEGLPAEQRDELIATVRRHIIRMNRRLGGPGGNEETHIAAAGFEGIGHTAGE